MCVCVFVCVTSVPLQKDDLRRVLKDNLLTRLCSLRSSFSGYKKFKKHFPLKSNYVSSFGNVHGDFQPGPNGGVQNG